MALTCLYAATGKNAGLASDGLPLVTASHRSAAIAWNTGPRALGLVLVWWRRPAPGATGTGATRIRDGDGNGAADSVRAAGLAVWPDCAAWFAPDDEQPAPSASATHAAAVIAGPRTTCPPRR